MEEIWKNIENYSNYMVSNKGNVKSFCKSSDGIILKPNKRGGYNSVALTNKDGLKRFNIHRLVACAFIPNTENLPYVNHKNGNKCDNSAENLEWCTSQYNTNHYYRKLKKGELLKDRQVFQYLLNGQFVKCWDSVYEASVNTGLSVDAILHSCNRRNKHLTTGGYIWRFKGDNNVNINYESWKKVVQLNKYGEKINTYLSIADASRITNVASSIIGRHCVSKQITNNCYWRYECDFNDEEFKYFQDKTFIKYTDDGVFIDSFYGIHELVDKTGLDFVKVVKSCRQNSWCGGFHWCIKEEKDLSRPQKRRKAVICLDKEMNYVKEYNSITEGSIDVGVQPTHISICCRNLTKSAGGFRWMYKDDYIEYLKKCKD